MNEAVVKKVEKFFSEYPERHYPKGQILIYGGDDSDDIYYLKKGKVREYDISYRGDELVLNVFKPGSFFPMAMALNKSTNPYFFKTETESVVHIVSGAEALEFIKTNPEVLLDLLKRVYSGMDGLLGRMVELMSGTAKDRLVYELIIECRRFGVDTDKGKEITVSEVDLAARSGLSRETVSREMQGLKEQRLVVFAGSKLVVPDLKKLEQKIS